MPVLKDLLDAYNTVEKFGHPQIVFPTVWHELKAADAEVVITSDGCLVRIRRLERWVTKENENGKKIKVRGDCDAVTPVTLYSECRTGSKPAPRPLSDSCKYFAGDLAHTERKFFDAEMELLHSWNEFAGGNRKLEAVIAYLSKETLAGDIVSSGVLDEVAEKEREEALQKLAVRFVISDDTPERPWEDGELIRSWDSYMCHMGGRKVVDSVTGVPGYRIHRHGKNILSENANGKLISSSPFEETMLHKLGSRFDDDSQVPCVTWETSVKVHRMLRWLMANRAIRIRDKDSTTFWTCFSRSEPVHIDFDAIAQETGMPSPADYGRILRDAIGGKEFEVPDEDLTVLALDYSSKGRDAFVYYLSVDAGEFFLTLKKWRERYRIDTQNGYYYPSLFRIVQDSYGYYDNAAGTLLVKEAVMKKHLNRLMRCFLEGRDVPGDIVQCAVENVKKTSRTPEVMMNVLRTADVLLRGGGFGNMEITDENQSRSFLYGRLLAVYDTIESAAVFKKNLKRTQKVDRPTNATKLWASYVADPENIAPKLHAKVIRGYMKWLSANTRNYYDGLIAEILARIDDSDKSARQLGGEYIIGYTKQKTALRERSRKIKEEISKKGGNDEEYGEGN